jgi:hypothetical protein
LETIEKLPGSKAYNSFAYDTALLQDFVVDQGKGGRRSMSGSHRGSVTALRLSGGSFRGSLRGSFRSRSVFRKKQRSGSFTGGGGSFSGKSSFFTRDFNPSESRGKGSKGPPAAVVLKRSGSR